MTCVRVRSRSSSKGLRYGTSPRALLDVHTYPAERPRPAVVFIYGGGWSSGSRWMYTLVGDRLAELGSVAAIIDYTVFPDGYVDHMLQEVADAILWTQREIAYARRARRERLRTYTRRLTELREWPTAGGTTATRRRSCWWATRRGRTWPL